MGLDCPDVRHIIHWGPQQILSPTFRRLGELGEMGTCPALCYIILLQITAFLQMPWLTIVRIRPNVIANCFLMNLTNSKMSLRLRVHSVYAVMCASLYNCNLCSEYRFPVSCAFIC